MRILLADDHEAVRHRLRALLEGQGQWEVCGEAVDGRDAVEKTQALKPDVVILDISMPNLSGFAAAKLIRGLCPKVPILLCSIHSSEAVLEQARRIGVDGYVCKSQDSPTLLAAVAAVQGHHHFFVE